MDYTTLEEIENRIGYSLSDAEASSISAQITNFSAFIDEEISAAGKQIGEAVGEVSLRRVKTFCLKRAVNSVLTADFVPGLASYSHTVGEESYSSSVDGNNLALTLNDEFFGARDKRYLGLSSQGPIFMTQLPRERSHELFRF